MNSKFYKIGAWIGISLIAIVIVCIVMAKNNDKKIAKAKEQEEQLISSSANEVEENTLTVDIKKENFNEIENKAEENKTTSDESSKTNIAQKTSSKSSKEKNETAKSTSSSVQEKAEEVVNKDPVFNYPVKGDIITDYAKDKLIYSNTLGEWVTHLGIDFKAAKTSIVTASAEGTVKSIKNDPRYGLTVVVEHVNGFSTVYSNLLTAEFVSVGEKVRAGQTLGTVGNTASFEILDESHLHFEILKDGEQVDPNMYLKK